MRDVAESAPQVSHLVSPRERSRAIDLARGWALLGVGAVHSFAFSAAFALDRLHWDRRANALDTLAEYVNNLVFAHRSFPVLAFLAGLGVAQIEARDFRHGYARLCAMLLFGVLLGFSFWPDEIVTAYALLGVWAAETKSHFSNSF